MVLPIVMYRCENWTIKNLNCGVGELLRVQSKDIDWLNAFKNKVQLYAASRRHISALNTNIGSQGWKILL